MRPSRIVVGEVRQAESLDLLIALNSGLPGMCTIHANSAREAVTKMCTLPLLAGENVSGRFVVPTVAASIDLVVHVALERDGRAPGPRDRRASPAASRATSSRSPTSSSRRGGALVRADGFPPHVDRFERAGYDLSALLAQGCCSVTGLLLGLLLGSGCSSSGGAAGCPRERPPPRARRPGPLDRLADELAQAGFAGLSVRTLLAACVVASLLVLALVRPRSASCRSPRASPRWPPTLPLAVVRRPRPTPPGAAARPLAGRRRQPHLGGPRRAVAARGARASSAIRGPEELRRAFRGVRRGLPASGRFGDSLDRLKERLSDPVADRLVESLRIAREVGGTDLGRLLRTLSGFLREDARTRGRARDAAEVDGQRGPARRGRALDRARAAVDATPSGARPTTAPPVRWCCSSVVSSPRVAYRVMVRIGRLPEEERVLR